MLGNWNDILINVNWSHKDDGFFKVWLNGKQVYSFAGPTKTKAEVYFKFGIYRGKVYSGDAEGTHIVYYDEIRYAKKSCKKLKLEDLGYNCKDLESQTASRIDKIKGK